MKHGKATQAIHGKRHDRSYLSAVYPIYQTSSFGVHSVDDYADILSGKDDVYMYSRMHNPTVRNVEEKMAMLENGEDAVLFSSGMAAITSTLLALLKPGDTVAASRPLYGLTQEFIEQHLPRQGITGHSLSAEELYSLEKHVPDARVVYIETPANPTCRCVDIRQVVAAARRVGALVVADNTFASPINTNPLDMGVDVVLHSATKYIGGHSDVVAGVAVARSELIAPIRSNLKMYGGCSSPIEAFLLDRSLKTLKLRVEAQNRNALALAQFFADHPRVQQVHYAGLPDSPDHAVAKTQMRGFGCTLAIEFAEQEQGKRFCDALGLGLSAVSLGSTETLINMPSISTHASLGPERLARAGVTPGLVRISVGVEDIDDLIADCQQALAAV